ncbi:hypothetical protein IAG44_19710 [Streptomyces roseirectus]|uniref:CobQ/CobB/MinD/ParA nucleotide binding domain-containing protein n=1 Tax=Streptomyces roseirectus TaxID=2768066 RepID=A0A7H0IF75_9ACTN|nr:hypothetical protein [Streptomyces roseirectus]QNP71441.1 hypothetical protein IAG44_19710 [Streptomyces roseirectus]
MGTAPVPVPHLPPGSRLLVPVLAATGGSGRTTVAHLLARGLAAVADTVLLDLAPRLASSWPHHLAAGRTPGLAALPPDQPLTRTAVRAACAVPNAGAQNSGTRTGAQHTTTPHGNAPHSAGPHGTAPHTPGLHVLTDSRAWHAPPLLDLPELPAAWYQLAAIGGWQAVVADTPHPLAHDLLTARHTGERALTHDWYDLPHSVPVLCAPATADGIHALHRATTTLDAEALPLSRTVVALTSTTDGRLSSALRATLTTATTRVAAVVHIPHDPRIRAHGHATPNPRPRTRHASGRLTDTVLNTAHRVWGRPLPPAPQPAPLA